MQIEDNQVLPEPAKRVTASSARRSAHEAVVRQFVTERGGQFLVVSRNQHFYLNMRNTVVRFLSLPDSCVRPVWPPDTVLNELAELGETQTPAICFLDCDVTGALCVDLVTDIHKDSPDTSIIILAFEVTRDVLVYLHEEGVNNILVLPASPDVLIEKLARTIHPPGPLADLFETGRRHLRSGDFPQAAASARNILERMPGSPGGLILLGDALHGMGRTDEAIGAYDAASRGEALYLTPLVKMASIHHEQGHLDQEIEFLRKLSELSPLNAERKVAIGVNYLRLGDKENAQQAFDEAFKAASRKEVNQPALVSRIIGDHCLEFAPDYAERYYRQALGAHGDKLGKSDVETLNQLGLALRRQGKWGQAVNEYTRALKILPDNASLHYNIAMAYTEGERHEDAAKVLDKVLAGEPDFLEKNAQAALNAAKAYQKAGRIADARNVLQKALWANPELAQAKEMMASLG